MSGDEANRARVVVEILDDVREYHEGEGPEGPWEYRSLTIKRIMNVIFVFDVDGVMAAALHVPDLSDVDNPYTRLERKLDEIHERTLDEL